MAEGEKMGLVGRNGHGKTTLFRILAGLEEADTGQIITPKTYRIGILEQHFQFQAQTLISEVCQADSMNAVRDQWWAEKMLTGLGFSMGDLERNPREFSGGYQVRLNLARLLLSSPDLLLLDEPTNFLDILSIRWLGKFLSEWRGEMILITHDRSFMDKVVTSVLGIHRKKGRKVRGQTTQYYDQVTREERIYEKSRLNQEKKEKQARVFISKFRAKARQAGMVQSRIKSLEKQEPREKLTKETDLSFRFNWSPFEGKYLLQVNDLSFSYASDAPLLFEGLRMLVEKGNRVCVAGANGRGKSTLIRNLVGKLNPTSGTIRFHPQVRNAWYEQANVANLNPDNTVEEEIINACPPEARARARSICGTMMFSGDNAMKKVRVLSGGEKCRVLLGKLLATPANLLFLDEPTHHLDMPSIDALINALKTFNGGSVIVTHNERILSEVATALVVFQNDRASFFEGSYAEFIDMVGWQDDGSSKPTLHHVGELPKSHNDDLSPKDSRRIRAEKQRQKNALLNPLKKRVSQAEDIVHALEAEKDALNEQLIKASQSGNSTDIATLSRALKKVGEKLDDSCEQFFKVSEELENTIKDLNSPQTKLSP